ncbi:DUF7344 domain-containing protein [Natrinema salaciae]|uniref:DUF7344 domain-containing protein n=1 Tax=Natrinema salaciae TaxID=1186196 RepID=A0A1H9C1M3_9EURY|nr:hypothetical protein [Natrinema salaciae]SEP94528.1 hypothetical protein SAMN04489841_0914 [Natrinema salaciae]
MRETEGGTALTGEATPSLDLVFELLSDSRRRYILYHLHDQSDGVATIENLTENVAALEQATERGDAGGKSAGGLRADSDRGSADRRTDIQLELQHVHLPKLEDAGVIEHDRRSDTVRYWSQPSLEEWLEHAQHKELG